MVKARRTLRSRWLARFGGRRLALPSGLLPRALLIHRRGIEELKRAQNWITVISRLEGAGAVKNALFALRCGCNRYLPPRRASEFYELVELRASRLWPGESELGTRHLEVLHEVAPDDIVVVA